MAAQSGIATFIGARTRQKYNKMFYLDDTAGHLANWDAGAGASATSPQYVVLPENAVIIDICIAAATAQTKTQLGINGVQTGGILLNAVHLASIATRPALAVAIGAMSQFQMTQLA